MRYLILFDHLLDREVRHFVQNILDKSFVMPKFDIRNYHIRRAVTSADSIARQMYRVFVQYGIEQFLRQYRAFGRDAPPMFRKIVRLLLTDVRVVFGVDHRCDLFVRIISLFIPCSGH